MQYLCKLHCIFHKIMYFKDKLSLEIVFINLHIN